MATDVYLLRKNLQWAKFSDVTDISLTGASISYSSVTGNNGTSTFTITGNTLEDGDAVYFQSLAGGSSLSTLTTYWVVSASGNTFQLALTPGGAPVSLGSNVTAAVLVVTADELSVWSSEFRDQFTASTEVTMISGGGNNEGVLTMTNGQVVPDDATLSTTVSSASPPVFITSTGLTVALSDEVSHAPLRQTLLKRTHWKFDRGASISPRYLYATWADGDIICDNEPASF